MDKRQDITLHISIYIMHKFIDTNDRLNEFVTCIQSQTVKSMCLNFIQISSDCLISCEKIQAIINTSVFATLRRGNKSGVSYQDQDN